MLFGMVPLSGWELTKRDMGTGNPRIAFREKRVENLVFDTGLCPGRNCIASDKNRSGRGE
jgi:hypothetical protein